MKKILTILFICTVSAVSVFASTNEVAKMDTLAVRAIIGEAAGEPLKTKLAIASALRNRGTLDGVRGLHNARMIDAQPAWVWRDARSAWSQSATNDITCGATHFESTNFPAPYWSRGMTATTTVGKFKFYKP